MKLNLGCGNDYREGFVNLDYGKCRADVYHDLNVTPYPFDDNQISYIFAQQVLEHVNRDKWLVIIRELHRISKPNAIWEIMTPYALSDNFFTDPTHSMPFTPRTFDYFDKTRPLGELGIIYGIDFELLVLDARLVKNPPNGPDVYFKIEVVKQNNSESISTNGIQIKSVTTSIETSNQNSQMMQLLKKAAKNILSIAQRSRKLK